MIRAHLVLKAATTAGGGSDIPTAATIKQYVATPDTVELAVRAAEELGFKVVDVSPLRVTIEAPKARFEVVFAAQVIPSGGAPKRRGTATETPTRSRRWARTKPPTLPPELSKAV